MLNYTEIDRTEDFEYFIKNYDNIYKKYGHKFIVIKHKKILGAYETVIEAINTTSKLYPLGEYIVQECNGDSSGYTNYISSWQIVEA